MKTSLLTALALTLAIPLLLAVSAIIRNRVPLFDPPGLRVRLMTYLTSNVAETRPDHPFPELCTPTVPLVAGPLRQRVTQAIHDLGWQATDDLAGEGEIHAVVRTPLLGFKDDLVVRVEPMGPGRSRLHLSSRSRVGQADFGANSRHLLDLLVALEIPMD